MTYSNKLPVHDEQMISYPYGEIDPLYSCGWHTGVDIVPHGSTENNPKLYPIKPSQVISVTYDNTLGQQCLIFDGTYYWRYCHMVLNSVPVQAGDIVSTSTVIGRMGDTGNVTGRHLHLECSTTQAWQCSTFVNPCTIMGIPNIDDEVLIWTPSPVPPAVIKKHKFKWVLYANKLRKRRC